MFVSWLLGLFNHVLASGSYGSGRAGTFVVLRGPQAWSVLGADGGEQLWSLDLGVVLWP